MTNLVLIFIALPLFLFLYGMVPTWMQKPLLICASVVYYFIWSDFSLWAVGVLAGLILINVILSGIYAKIQNAKGKSVFLWGEVIINLIPLIIIKLLSTSFFDRAGLKLPGSFAAIPGGVASVPGISFFTFTVIALHIDIHRSGLKISWLDQVTFLTEFPKLAMGPIVRFSEQKSELDRLKTVCGIKSKHLRGGIKKFILGLGLKVLIANQLATIWTAICTSGTLGLTWETAWLGAFVYSIEIYLDFWGYSLMAIGLGKMIGLRIPDNFDSPYQARTVSEFWRRWHITLGTWFKDYIYIPLGGNRSGKARMILNLSVVWIITGLWHGMDLNFVIWGVVLGLLVILEKVTPLGKLGETKIIGHIYVIVVMLLTWMLFAHTDFKQMYEYLGCMFGIYPQGATPAHEQFFRYIYDHWYLIILGIAACLPQARTLAAFLHKKRWATIIYLIIFWASVYVMYTSASTPFIYAAF